MPDDASRVYFTTGEPLVAEDVNGRNDAYQYDVGTGKVHILSTGSSDTGSFFLDASANGQDVFLATRDQLSAWDGDQNMDVYDARVDGGVRDPVQPPECAGDACQGPPRASRRRRLRAPASSHRRRTDRTYSSSEDSEESEEQSDAEEGRSSAA